MMNDIIIYVKYGTLSLQLSLSRTSGIGRVMAVYKDLCVSFTSSPFANRKKTFASCFLFFRVKLHTFA